MFVEDLNPKSLPTPGALRNYFGRQGTVVRVMVVDATCKAVIWFESQEQADRIVRCARDPKQLKFSSGVRDDLHLRVCLCSR